MKEIDVNHRQFQNVLKKAIEQKPLVRLCAESGAYLVRGSKGDLYPVTFQVGGGGRRLGSCLCAGAMKGFYCYHLAAALIVHTAFVRAGLRAPAARRAVAA